MGRDDKDLLVWVAVIMIGWASKVGTNKGDNINVWWWAKTQWRGNSEEVEEKGERNKVR